MKTINHWFTKYRKAGNYQRKRTMWNTPKFATLELEFRFISEPLRKNNSNWWKKMRKCSKCRTLWSVQLAMSTKFGKMIQVISEASATYLDHFSKMLECCTRSLRTWNTYVHEDFHFYSWLNFVSSKSLNYGLSSQENWAILYCVLFCTSNQ